MITAFIQAILVNYAWEYITQPSTVTRLVKRGWKYAKSYYQKEPLKDEWIELK